MRRTPLSRTIGNRAALAQRVGAMLRPSLWLGLALLSLCGSGCSRPFWRTQADFDAYNLLLEKMADARWNVPRLTLEADPRARIFDPYDPDFEPLPPDDASANRYMH